MSGGNINAAKCAAYLRSVGVYVASGLAADWIEAEREHRAANRSRKRELKKSCGHFRTYVSRVISDECGDEAVTTCHDCRRYIARKPWSGPPPRGGGKPIEKIA